MPFLATFERVLDSTLVQSKGRREAPIDGFKEARNPLSIGDEECESQRDSIVSHNFDLVLEQRTTIKDGK